MPIRLGNEQRRRAIFQLLISVKFRLESIITRANPIGSKAILKTCQGDPTRFGDRLSAFGHGILIVSRNLNRRGGVRGNDHMELEGVIRQPPFADNFSAHRIVTGLHLRQVADDIRMNDEMFETGRLRVGLDAGQIMEKPLVNLAQHEVILRSKIANASVPLFRQARRTLLQLVAIAGLG